MGNDLSPGYLYNTSTQKNVTAANLNQAIGDAILKETAISAKTLKAASAADEIMASDGSGTLKKITASGIAALATAPPTEVPAGIIASFAANSTPTGWLPCNGAAILISSYSALSTAIYCGDANNATAPFGYKVTDSGGATRATAGTFIVLPDLRGYFVRGAGTNSDGTASGTFGVKQADDFKSHTHTQSGNGWVYGASTPYSYGTASQHGVSNTGATGGTETRPRNIPLLYCIKF